MSLIKQLWIAVAVVTALAFGGNLIIGTLSARHYLEQQLYLKNLDNATSLALSMSQLPKDPVTVELQVAAQFDSGHYRLIRLIDPAGALLVEREFAGVRGRAPDWFVSLIPIVAPAATAQVQDGWRQFGTLTLESHSHFAHEALWAASVRLFAWFLVGALLAGGVGTLVIRHVTRPLARVVEQAQAIGERRFLTMPEPGTTEFSRVVRAMNTLSERVRNLLADESLRLEHLRRATQHDELTGLFNRGQWLNQLDAALGRDDAHAGGAVALVRVANLATLNQQLGRADADGMLLELARCLEGLAAAQPERCAGRMNGSDFALLAPGGGDPGALAAELAAALETALEKWGERARLQVPVGIGAYHPAEPRAHVLARADGALAAAEQVGGNATRVAQPTDAVPAHADLAEWRRSIEHALDAEGVQLECYPVVSTDGGVLHQEAPMRLHLSGAWRRAGYFMPWATRLGLMARLDTAVAREALARIGRDGVDIGINLSPESLREVGFQSDLLALLRTHPDERRRLWIEVPEYGVVRHPAEFRALYAALKPLGCRLGIEHVGLQFSHIGELHTLGLDYLKVDAAMIRGIDVDTGNQSFVRGLCVIAHAIGLTVIAEGVASEAELGMLAQLGVDGLTGPVVAAVE